jgi:hypothetical protein
VEFLRQWIGVLLIVLGLARAGIVVLAEPMEGYANQGDMHRTSACTGLFPADEKAAQAPTPDAPTARFAIGSRTEGCYQSAEVIIAATTVAIYRATGGDPAKFKLSWVGYVKLALLFGVALVFAWLLRDHAAAGALHGLIVLLVLADPVVTLWMNTLYTDFAVILSLYVVTLACSVLALYDRQSYLSWALLLVGLVTLAISREQFALLPVALVLAAWPWLWLSSTRLTVVTVVIALLMGFVSLFVLPRPQEVRKMTRTDTYLGLLVPASSTPQRGLAILNLPESCAPVAGAEWRTRRAEVEKACPQVYALSSFAFLRFVSDEPMALLRAKLRGFSAIHGIAPGNLGVIDGQPGKTIEDLPPWSFSPLKALDAMLPAPVFNALTLFTFLLAPAGLITLIVLRRYRGDPLTPMMLAMFLGGTAIYAYATTIFGDGLNEAGRHYLPGTLAMYTVVIAGLYGLGTLAVRWKETPREMKLEIPVGAAILGIIAFAVVTALAMIPA